MAKQNGSRQIAHYKTRDVLKMDDLSAVYLADDMNSGKTVILKTLRTDRLPDPTMITRFKREASLLAAMHHPGIITSIDSGSEENILYISFEYFESKNLRFMLQEDLQDDAVRFLLVKQFFAALRYAHSLNIIHRDLKPENIFVAADNHLKLGDFGLATGGAENFVTSQFSVVGTPGYMSPEQIQGQQLTLKSDLFAAGIVVFEMFTGKNPFIGKDVNETLNNIINFDEAELQSQIEALPEEIIPLLKNILRKEPDNRNEIVFQLAENLPGAIPFLKKEKKKKPVFYTMYAASVVILAALSMYIFNTNGEAPVEMQQLKDIPLQFADTSQTVTDSDTEKDNAKKEKTTALLILETKTEVESEKVSNADDEPVTEVEQVPEQIKAAANGELFVECLPWAVVYIDSVRYETTPLKANITLKEGSHSITLVNPGYPLYKSEITINEGEVTRLKVNLENLMGYLDCKVNPWGEIFVNGVLKGETPLKIPIKLAPGQYKVVIKNKEFPQAEFTVQILQNETFVLKHTFRNLN